MRTVIRQTGRVLPVHEGRVLLLRGGDPRRNEAGQWWFSVGGGCEPGESPAAAARREAMEEAGLVLPEDLGEVVLRRQVAFEFDGEWLEQSEEYYLCRLSSADVVTAGWTELEQRVVSGYRWWSVPELLVTSEVVYPEGLAELLEGLPG